MKLFLVSLLMTAMPHWLPATVAWACDQTDEPASAVLVVAGDKVVTADHDCVVTTGGEGEHAFAFVTAVGEGDDETHGKRKVVRISSKGDDAGKRGWLGVSIDEVPEPLAAQLDIEGRGVIVINVAAGSPADLVGFEVHDVIISIDDKDVEGEVGRAVDLIKSHGAGDEANIIVLREGKERNFSVTLGSRASLKGKKLKWKFEGSPTAEVEERIKTIGKILRRGDDDEWIFEDLGDLKHLKNLPKHIEMFFPKSGSRSTQIFVEGGQRRIKTKVERDGSTIVIVQEDDGEITVTRVDEDGDKTTATYDDEDELLEADEEAYELLGKASESIVIQLDVEGIEIPDIEIPDIEIPDIVIPDIQFHFDTDKWAEHMEELGSTLEERIGRAQEAYDRAMEKFDEAMERWKSGEGFPEDLKVPPPPPKLFGRDGRSEHPGFAGFHRMGKLRHTFEVSADGTIEVRIRKGDSELVQIYEDEDDLARRSPKLMKKYKRLMALEEDDE